ncbi:MAG: SUMF1/EgtB/PvdO family nonheme iron enzyme [Deltaproteobacteria bacterium]|nr:SUMF1/EgtB/PvdO family nonheme iron enzyme [Deltaproteobacteria bacterium]
MPIAPPFSQSQLRTWFGALAALLVAPGCIENLASEAELNQRLAAQQAVADGLGDAGDTGADSLGGADQNSDSGTDQGSDSNPGDDSATDIGGNDLLPVDDIDGSDAATCNFDGDCSDLNPCTDDLCISHECNFFPHMGDNPCPESQACLNVKCQPVQAVCGDSAIGPGEMCDDGNSSSGDGCSATCQVEGVVPAYMQFIPSTTFQMGCTQGIDAGCASDQEPVHSVKLSAFFIDQAEVTVAAYQQCMIDGACTAPGTGDKVTMGDKMKSGYPVNFVDRGQAAAFCKHVSKRLCTEAEWEFAARGQFGYAYPWGDTLPGDLCQFANSKGCQDGPAATGTYFKGDSPFGVWDMAGNVAEWVADLYGPYKAGPTVTNPTGPAGGPGFVVRGGHWGSEADALRATARDNQGGSTQSAHIGFRCCMSL